MSQLDAPSGIWPPYLAFYYESMLNITRLAEASLNNLNAALARWSNDPYQIDPNDVLNPVQNIVSQGAALSRYFWLSGKAVRNPLHIERAEFLKQKFCMTDDSPLKSRTLRDTIEHFDERLDMLLANGIAGQIIPQFIGDLSGERDVPIYVFRAFDPSTATVEILGERFAIEPILEEMQRVYGILTSMRHVA